MLVIKNEITSASHLIQSLDKETTRFLTIERVEELPEEVSQLLGQVIMP